MRKKMTAVLIIVLSVIFGAYPAAATHAGGEKNRNVGKSRHEIRENRTDAGSGARSGGTFSKTFTFNVSDYNVTQQDAFDLVEIPGAETDVTDYLPVLPFLMATLNLPKDASAVSVRLTGGTTESLGRLNIPTYLLIPGPDAPPSFTDVMYVTGLYPETNCTHRVFHGRDDTEVIIYFVPVQHNVDTKETTLWKEATVEVQYEVDECIFISALRTDKEDYITTEPVIVTATLRNVGDTDVTGLTAAASITRFGETLRTSQVSVGPVPAGGSTEVTVSVDNGLDTDTYPLIFEIRDESGSVTASLLKKGTFVTSGRTEIGLSGESLIPGDQLDLTVTYENYHTYQVTADILFELYDEKYRMVMAVPGSPTEIAAGSSESMTWHLYTGNLAPGEYEVVAVAEMESGDCVTRSEFVVRDPDDNKYHSADHTPRDFRISLSELLRVIQLYSSGSFHCAPGTEDGYAPGDGDRTCTPHNSDYAPQDWYISLGGLLRLIQLYSSDGYRPETGTEDGFAPGKRQ